MTRIRFAILISFTFVLCACALQAHAWDDVDGPAAGEPESIGRYAAGCVIGAARLPPDGPGYQAIRLERIGPVSMRHCRSIYAQWRSLLWRPDAG